MRSLVGAAVALVVFCGTAGTTTSAPPPATLPAGITSVMHGARYAHASWNLLVTDLATGRTVYELNPDRLAFTGSVRKLFSVGLALNALGAHHRFVTPVYRRGSLQAGTLHGDLILVGMGDLVLGGRAERDDRIAFTNFDHNDANNLGTASLTPQDPLRGLNDLARQVRASGITAVSGDVLVDDRLFESYRVPNGNLLITPILVNENMVDVTVSPTRVGRPARVDWRPKTAAFGVSARVGTVAATKPEAIALSNDALMRCAWPAACRGTVTGSIPVDYKAPLSGSPTFVRTFRVESPATFARIAFVQALSRAGVRVSAPMRASNDIGKLPPRDTYSPGALVATLVSAPFSEYAKLVLKVSLNLGANLDLSLFGLTKEQRTIGGALAAERTALVSTMGIPANEFAFPSNGSGSPDSRAAPRATVRMLVAMSEGSNANAFRRSLPILGVDGSLAETGGALAAKGHVFAKTGTTIDATGLKAQVLAGYIDAESGRRLAFALYVNNAGPIKSIADVAHVFTDEAVITNVIYKAAR